MYIVIFRIRNIRCVATVWLDDMMLSLFLIA